MWHQNNPKGLKLVYKTVLNKLMTNGSCISSPLHPLSTQLPMSTSPKKASIVEV